MHIMAGVHTQPWPKPGPVLDSKENTPSLWHLRELEEVRATSPLLSLLGPVGVKKVPSPATLVGVKL